jgi:hypothetical protein
MDWQITLLGASALIVALMSIYLPSVYIRKTNKVIALLEQGTNSWKRSKVSAFRIELERKAWPLAGGDSTRVDREINPRSD